MGSQTHKYLALLGRQFSRTFIQRNNLCLISGIFCLAGRFCSLKQLRPFIWICRLIFHIFASLKTGMRRHFIRPINSEMSARSLSLAGIIQSNIYVKAHFLISSLRLFMPLADRIFIIIKGNFYVRLIAGRLFWTTRLSPIFLDTTKNSLAAKTA